MESRTSDSGLRLPLSGGVSPLIQCSLMLDNASKRPPVHTAADDASYCSDQRHRQQGHTDVQALP